MTHRVAVVGTGGISHEHGAAYRALPDCELVACADIDPGNAGRFAEEFGVPETFADHRELLAATDPDVVSVCTPPSAHADPVVDCARAGVAAVHCEKPMADTWGDARLMAQECWRRGVQLTVNHENRFADPVERARDLVEDGAVGAVRRVEMGRDTLFESGTHLVDLCHWFAGDRPAEWVLGGIDYTRANVRKGTHNENSALAVWAYPDGVHGLALTGVDADFAFRVVGTDGELELPGVDTAGLWLRSDGRREFVECEADMRGHFAPAIEHAIRCLETGAEPLLSADRALAATELIFGVWESSRRRGRVEFPLDIADNPLEAMVADGRLDPADGG